MPVVALFSPSRTGCKEDFRCRSAVAGFGSISLNARSQYIAAAWCWLFQGAAPGSDEQARALNTLRHPLGADSANVGYCLAG